MTDNLALFAPIWEMDQILACFRPAVAISARSEGIPLPSVERAGFPPTGQQNRPAPALHTPGRP